MCTHVCERGRARSVCRAARAHTPYTVPTTARSPLSVLMAAHKPSGVRGVRGPSSRTQHTRRATEGVGEERRIGGRAAFTARAHRGRRARAPLSRRSRLGPLEPGGRREVRHTAACSPTSLLRWVERRQRQRREPRGECGIHNTRACVHIRHGESGCGPSPKRSQPRREFETFSDSATDPGPPRHS